VQILKFAGWDGNVWTAIENLIGNCQNVARNLSFLPGAVIFETISKATLEITPASSSAPAVTRNLSPVEAGQVGLAWRITRRIAGKASGKFWGTYPDELVGATMTPTSLPTILPTPTMPSANGSTPQGRQIKAALVIDQLDEGILSPADPSLVQTWHDSYQAEKKAEPPPAREPTENQLTALHHRVVVAHRTPYVDLSIWDPYGRKVHKRNRFRNWIPDGEGGYLSQEIPGPENYQVWLIGWRVFTTACVMLRIVSTSAFEAYETRIEKLVRLWGDAWHFIYTTDDHMRA